MSSKITVTSRPMRVWNPGMNKEVSGREYTVTDGMHEVHFYTGYGHEWEMGKHKYYRILHGMHGYFGRNKAEAVRSATELLAKWRRNVEMKEQQQAYERSYRENTGR